MFNAKQILDKIKVLGESLAKKDVIIITGACTGIPYQVASVAYKQNKTEIWGFSPYKTYTDHYNNEVDDNSIYSKLIYIRKHVGLLLKILLLVLVVELPGIYFY